MSLTDKTLHRILKRFGTGPNFDVWKSTKLGNQVSFTAVDIGTLANFPNPNGKRLLEANIVECEPEKAFDAASWVLTLRTDAIWNPAGVGGNYNQMLATITLGAGATQTTFDVDISRGDAFQIPAGNVTVNAALAGPMQSVGAPGQVFLPSSQLVTASIHRAQSSAKPTRSFLWRSTAAVSEMIGPAGFAGNIPVPPLATGVFVFGQSAAAGMYAAGSSLAFTAGDGGTVMVVYTPAQMQASVATGVPLPVPAVATAFNASAGAASAPNAFETIQFVLDI